MTDDRITPDAATQRILAALVAWNLFDIVLHIAVNEVEVLRVSANVILIVVARVLLVDRVGPHPAHPLVPALLAFVVLNLIVMIDKGPAVPMITLSWSACGSPALRSNGFAPHEERRRIGRR